MNILINLISPFINWSYFRKTFSVLEKFDARLVAEVIMDCRGAIIFGREIKQYQIRIPKEGSWHLFNDDTVFFE